MLLGVWNWTFPLGYLQTGSIRGANQPGSDSTLNLEPEQSHWKDLGFHGRFDQPQLSSPGYYTPTEREIRDL